MENEECKMESEDWGMRVCNCGITQASTEDEVTGIQALDFERMDGLNP